MAKCPNCKRELTKPVKSWKYQQFDVEAYLCDKCGTRFREYAKDGKHSFTLQLERGKFRKYIKD